MKVLLSVGILSSQSTKDTHSQAISLAPKSTQTVLTFSPDEDIDYAFSRLSSGIKTMIESSGCKLAILQGACLEKALSPKACISGKIVPKIEAVSSFQALCITLTKAQHWNFLDTRMMEAMVTASMIPAAQETLQNFKEAFYGMKLSEVVPFIPVIPLKSSHISIEEQLDVDPRQYTIGELNKHRFYLESELFESGSGTVTCYKIVVGSLFIVWQIHVDLVYKAYLSLSKKKSFLQSQAISHLSIPSVTKWASLPVMLRGQEVNEVGPIEQPLQDRKRKDSYSLPQGLQWTWLNSHDAMKFIDTTKRYIQWAILHPDFNKDRYVWCICVQNTRTVVACPPQSMSIGGKFLPVMFLSIGSSCYEVNTESFDDRRSLVTSELLKEIVRATKEYGISHILIKSLVPFIVKPIAMNAMWHYYFVYPKAYLFPELPYDSPKTPGLRKMVPDDIPKALALTNQYASQFEFHQIFRTEEEFSHYFLCPSIPGYVITYVVEDPTSGSLTDLFGIRLYSIDGDAVAHVIAIVVTESPAIQFVTDLLICAKQEKADRVCTNQYGLPENVFKSLCMDGPQCEYLHMYNYTYPEVDERRCCLFSV